MDVQDLINHPIIARVSAALRYSFHKCVVTGSIAFSLQYVTMEFITDESDIDILLLPVVPIATNGGVVAKVKDAIAAARWHCAETSRGMTTILTATDPNHVHREVSFELRPPCNTGLNYSYSDISARATPVASRLYLLSAEDLCAYYTRLGRDKDQPKIRYMARFKQSVADSVHLLID